MSTGWRKRGGGMNKQSDNVEQGEPVGEMQLSAIYEGMVVPVVPVELPAGTKLYTTPDVATQRQPAERERTWEGLSVFEINDLVENTEYEDYRDLVERTEAKLREKNSL